MDDAEIVERLLADQRLLRLPLVRHANDVSAGPADATWRSWLAASRLSGAAASPHRRWHPTVVTERPSRTPSSRHRSGRVTMTPNAAERLAKDPTVTEDEKLFARSPRPAFLGEDPWRVLRIMSEFVDGFDALAEVGPAVTVFGSARAEEGSTDLRAGPRRSAASSPATAAR